MKFKSAFIVGAMLFTAQTLNCSAPKAVTPQQNIPEASSPSYLKRGGFATLGIASFAGATLCLYNDAKFIQFILEKPSRFFNQFTKQFIGKTERAFNAARIISSFICGLVGCYHMGKFGYAYMNKAF